MVRRNSVIARAGKAIVPRPLDFVGCYCALFGWMVYTSPLSYAEMDINHDGKVEFFEVDYASSFGEKDLLTGRIKMYRNLATRTDYR